MLTEINNNHKFLLHQNTKMGSCSNKPINEVQSIRTEKINSQTPKVLKPNPSEANNNKSHNHLSVPEISKQNARDVNSPRNARKNLTVLTTNHEEVELPPEFPFETSIKLFSSEGKPEPGSLFLVRYPIMIGGKPSGRLQKDFEEKLFLIEGDNVKRDFLLDHGVWVSCRKGMKPEMPNQDDFLVVVDHESLILGVFDGHGGNFQLI